MHPFNPYELFPQDFAALAAKSEKLARLAPRTGNHKAGKGLGNKLDKAARDDEDRSEKEFESSRNNTIGEDERLYIDFRDPDSSIALTEAMLEHDFGIHVSLRGDRLCPAVPNRINYIAWLQEIIDETQSTVQYISTSEANEEERPTKRIRKYSEPVRILDIGTGASCIYPILGCALDDWNFLATDIDAESINAAQDIIEDSRNQGISQANFNQGRRDSTYRIGFVCVYEAN